MDALLQRPQIRSTGSANGASLHVRDMEYGNQRAEWDPPCNPNEKGRETVEEPDRKSEEPLEGVGVIVASAADVTTSSETAAVIDDSSNAPVDTSNVSPAA